MEAVLSEEQIISALHLVNDGVFDWDIPSGEVSYSSKCKGMLGYDDEGFGNHIDAFIQLIHSDHRQATVQQVHNYIERASDKYRTVIRLMHKQGYYISVISSAYLFYDVTGKTTRFVGTINDISDLDNVTVPNSLQEHFYNVLLSEFPFAAWMKDIEGRYQVANVKLFEYLGITYSHQLIGKTVHDFFQPEVADIISSEVQDILKNGTSIHVEKEFNVTGGKRWFDIHQSPITINGTLHGTVGCAWDITERKLIEKALADSEERYRRVVEVSPEAIFIHCEGRFVFMNMAAATLLGAGKPEELYGQFALDFVKAEFRDMVAQRINNAWGHGDNPLIEEELVRIDGSTVKVEMISVHFNYLGKNSVLAIARDITERIKMQEELVKTQKLESLGVLAGGIAHDFNNILTAIIGNADLAMLRIDKESPGFDNLKRIEQSALKAADLAKQMLAYSGKGKLIIEQIDLNVLLNEMIYMLEVSISKNIVIHLNLAQQLPSIVVDATQFRQVIMNLVINASEAIGDNSGVISISTGCIDCDKSHLKDAWLIENRDAGPYVYLEVVDSGCGMDKLTVERIFEPFFTTKFTGRGLGMAAVLGIIRGHKGAIKVHSEPGKGSSFKILLPASDNTTEIFGHKEHEDHWKGVGTVLLVDDEETVRGVGKEMLWELGFEVLTANDGREALDAINNDPTIDLVLLDLTMPHMDGEECFRRVRCLRPDLKIIISSGYSEQEVTHKFIDKGLAGFIQKPYKLSTLKDSIRKIHGSSVV